MGKYEENWKLNSNERRIIDDVLRNIVIKMAKITSLIDQMEKIIDDTKYKLVPGIA